ncbi:hypothetical protein F5Y02DRAFT_432533 [Annulohypoxylon stygium]|nr:hypothetical protein F5Y02DRAFT_432533 [Annulohypoxylon stygium]
MSYNGSDLYMTNFQFNSNIIQQDINVGMNFQELPSPPIHQHNFTGRSITCTSAGGQDLPTGYPAAPPRYQPPDFNGASSGYGSSNLDSPPVWRRPSQPDRFDFTEPSLAVNNQSVIHSIHSPSSVRYSQVTQSISNPPSPFVLNWQYHEGTAAPTSNPIGPFNPNQTNTVNCSGSPSFCEECNRSFKYEKDFFRHLKATAAHPGSPLYHCACGKENPRKDNHKRHTKKCTKMDHDGQYKCKCNVTHLDKNTHLQHIKRCGLRPVGRPPAARR